MTVETAGPTGKPGASGLAGLTGKRITAESVRQSDDSLGPMAAAMVHNKCRRFEGRAGSAKDDVIADMARKQSP